MEKLLSIIIPVYNVEKYIERCVQSVVYQIYNNIEIILVNDGSTDTSGYICDKLKDKYSRIKVIHKENGGVCEARNYGLDIATGEYIAFVNGDNYICEKMYYFLINHLECYDADIAECGFTMSLIKFKTSRLEECKDIIEREPREVLIDYYKGKRFYPAVWGKVYKSELLTNIRFTPGKVRSEDLYFNMKVLRNVKKLVFISNKMYYYQQHDDNLTALGISLKAALDDIEAFRESLNYAKEFDEILFDLGNRAFIKFIFQRLDQCMWEKKSWNIKKHAFYAYAQELATFDEDVDLSLFPSRKSRFAIKLLRKNKLLFRLMYMLHKRINRKHK